MSRNRTMLAACFKGPDNMHQIRFRTINQRLISICCRVLVIKGKGDPMECGLYRAIKLLEHAMKVVERVLEKRIRGQVTIDEMQCGFRPGKGTTDGILIVRQLQEKHKEKKNLYYAFVDLEKAFHRVPR
jgi:hypothetical protein